MGCPSREAAIGVPGVSPSTPQPDSLAPSTGTVTVTTGGTFNSTITVNADIIFVKAGTSVTNHANYLGHQAAPVTTLNSINSSWSATAPPGYPSSPSYPSGGFYPIIVGGGHSTPTHVHAIIPAKCGPTGLSSQAAIAVQNCIAVAQ